MAVKEVIILQQEEGKPEFQTRLKLKTQEIIMELKSDRRRRTQSI